MFGLLPITKIISVIACSYGVLCVLIYQTFNYFGIELRSLVYLSGGILIEIFLLFIFNKVWRDLWSKFPILNKWIFPDLNGEWKAKIDWVKGGDKGSAAGKVLINQNFLKISIEMDADRSESKTIAISIGKDPISDKPILHYIYEVTEKHLSPGQNKIYKGAASLYLNTASFKELSGNYFTSRETGGRFSFIRC